MMTRTKELGKWHLALQYGEAKKQLYHWQSLRSSLRTGDQASGSIDTDVDVTRLRHEGTRHLPAGVRVNRGCLKFAGIFIGDTAVATRSRISIRMQAPDLSAEKTTTDNF